MGMPYMVSDVGGMSELVDLHRYSEAVVPHSSGGELAAALQTVLERGTLPVLPLRQTVRPAMRARASQELTSVQGCPEHARQR